MGGIKIILLIVLLVLAGCASKEISEEDKAMLEHCKMMPEMPGCEEHLEGSHMMDQGMMKDQMVRLQLDTYTRDVSNLKKEVSSEIIVLKDNEVLELSADIIKKKIKGKDVRMFGYNKQIPGPLFKVEQGDQVTVNFKNNLDVETTIHWHGLRLKNKFDGVPDVTQEPVKPGETFTYKIKVPDEGLYWYHPHMREDYQQESGLYGNILVNPKKDDYYNQVNKEELLILDDILLDDNGIVPFFKNYVDHALMGRFGNVMLVNGKTDYNLEVEKGSVVRFFVNNVANTRVFNLSITGAKLKIVGSDVSNYEKEFESNSVVIAPAERYIIEAYFKEEGNYKIKHINPHKTYILGNVQVSGKKVVQDYSEEFKVKRRNEYVTEDVATFREYFSKAPDEELILTIDMPGMAGMMNEGHKEKIEWEDEMEMMNTMATNNTLTWKLVDKETGKANMNINYNWKVGDKIKIRIFNDPKSMHPMQHPIHFHGQRFLVLEQDKVKNDNLVWKDTVLVPTGSYVDILMDITNPGEWMAHCHIAEHLHSDMMTMFKVK